MSWTLLIGLVLVLGIALFAAVSRRTELASMQRTVRERDDAIVRGTYAAQLQHPVVDLSRCLGCATCVAVCPEDGVLEILHGQAMVVSGSRCVGVAACERECPVGAITVTLSNLDERTDVPVLEGLEASGSPGLFLAGEVTAHALIRVAIEQGTAVGTEVARRSKTEHAPAPGVHDLCIVGAGPAGIACSLEATRHELDFVTLEREDELGGTVAKYPRHKLVLTEPVDVPLYGHLKATTYQKEQLIRLWRRFAREQQLPIRTGQVFRGLSHQADGTYVIETATGRVQARHVCLAIGRRGVPRKLGVAGEDLPHVAYNLIDAQSYRGRRILVVGGGDSAVEAALALAQQPRNVVTLSYRKSEFVRIRSKNAERLDKAVATKRLHVLYQSKVTAIHEGHVDLAIDGPDGSPATNHLLPADDVFIMAGGIPPFDLLANSGVSFDPRLRKNQDAIVEQGTGLIRALAVGLTLALVTLLWALWNADYYALPMTERPASIKHGSLRPGLGIGLWLGVTATVLIVVNLLYVLRRSPKIRLRFGSLQTWMTSHVATGILALLLTMLHAGMAPRDTPGGHAFWALVVLLITGAIGRYFYSYIPRAANGRELELAEVKSQLASLHEQWDHGEREFHDRARAEIEQLMRDRQWKGSLLGRVLALFGARRDLQRTLGKLEVEGRRRRISKAQIAATLALARRAHRTALTVAHFEDLRGVLNTWRWIHRWGAALMVLLVVVHIVHAITYGSFSLSALFVGDRG